ncbi:hypothetical protein KP77_31180 [Jeotgalibacillus alimentarius]|uniref:Uncharacterized protein n=1 Tax=Jeotgalibacillus alimentarius TaxID=135826 RepID=A0A0C2V2Y9_9BACL|nr:hypothetical protein [Jeotgalibacillus alimentarius]KIL43412.1 hypothetical protein KP77_31180 [Jeotgalibacillus alimentarius]
MQCFGYQLSCFSFLVYDTPGFVAVKRLAGVVKSRFVAVTFKMIAA